MLASVVAATLRTWMEGGPRLRAAAVPQVGTARRAAWSSPEKRGPTSGCPGKGHGAQVGAVGLMGAEKGSSGPRDPHWALVMLTSGNQSWDEGCPSALNRVGFAQKKLSVWCSFYPSSICLPITSGSQPSVCPAVGITPPSSAHMRCLCASRA